MIKCETTPISHFPRGRNSKCKPLLAGLPQDRSSICDGLFCFMSDLFLDVRPVPGLELIQGRATCCQLVFGVPCFKTSSGLEPGGVCAGLGVFAYLFCLGRKQKSRLMQKHSYHSTGSLFPGVFGKHSYFSVEVMCKGEIWGALFQPNPLQDAFRTPPKVTKIIKGKFQS